MSNHRLPEISEETQLRIMRYEADVLNRVVSLFERPGMPRPPVPRMDDQDRGREYHAQHVLDAAIRAMREAIKLTNETSSIVEIDARSFENWVSDEIKPRASWNEAISGSFR